MNQKGILVAIVALLMAVLACNIPYAKAPTPTPTNFGIGSEQVITPSNTPSGTPTQLIPVTGGQAIAQVSVTQPSNCRTGPGTAYLLVTSLNPGQVASVIGRYPPANYLIINSSSGPCWLWGQFAIVTGNINSVPVYQVPPLPTPTPTLTPIPQPTNNPAPLASPTSTFAPLNTPTNTSPLPSVPSSTPTPSIIITLPFPG